MRVAGSRDIQIEDNGQVGTVTANREIIQHRDDVRFELSRDTLIHRGRIEEAIGDHDCPLVEGGPDYLAHELAAAGFEQ